jgi:hypothetical protein
VCRANLGFGEGVVEVRSARELLTLRRGDSWQPDCVNAKVANELPVSPSRFTDHAGKTAASDSQSTQKKPALLPDPTPDIRNTTPESAATPSQTESVRISDLAKQNNIYARASAERNQGHSGEALELYQELISQFPSSALVESACVQRMRILRDANPAAAAREAKQYLSRFPKGFARGEAESLVGAP